MNLDLDFLGIKTNPSISEDNVTFETLDYLFDIAEERLVILNSAVSSINNLITIYDHVKMYGVTEENRRLFATSFESIGVAYSAENILKTGWTAIKNLIERIVKYIRETCSRLFEAVRKWFNNVFKKDLETMKDKTVPKDKEDEFNKRVYESAKKSSASNEAFDTPIDPDNLKKHSSWRDDGTLASVDSYIKVITNICDRDVKFVTMLEKIVKDNLTINSSDINNAEQAVLTPYDYKLPIAGGWGDSKKLVTLVTTCMTVEDTLENQVRPRLEKLMHAASLNADRDEMQSATASLNLTMIFMKALCEQVRDTIRIAKTAHNCKKVFCSNN